MKHALLEIKGTSTDLLLLTVKTTVVEQLQDALHEMCGDDADFFSDDLTVIALDTVSVHEESPPPDWAALRAVLRRFRLNLVGATRLPEHWHNSLKKEGLSWVEYLGKTARQNSRAPSQTSCPPQAETSSPGIGEAAHAPVQEPLDLGIPNAQDVETELDVNEPAASQQMQESLPPALPETLTHDRPLRSGQQIYARASDLTALAIVNPGAEVIADGSIHVYAPLRGRALAGASGQTKARIFTTCFQAELVSIAGVYKNFAAGVPAHLAGKAVQIRLVETSDGKQTLELEPLNIA